MSGWTSDELEKIGAAEELRIAPRRRGTDCFFSRGTSAVATQAVA